MTLLTAHKILIASVIGLFIFCAGWELRKYMQGDGAALLLSGASGGAAVGLALYLRWVWVHRRSRTPRS